MTAKTIIKPITESRRWSWLFVCVDIKQRFNWTVIMFLCFMHVQKQLTFVICVRSSQSRCICLGNKSHLCCVVHGLFTFHIMSCLAINNLKMKENKAKQKKMNNDTNSNGTTANNIYNFLFPHWSQWAINKFLCELKQTVIVFIVFFFIGFDVIVAI